MLPPVQSLLSGEAVPVGVPARGVPVPTLVAASSAPFPPPVYVFTRTFGLTAGFEKAEEAPRRAAFRTLYWVSPVDCGVWGWGGLRVLAWELIESPSDAVRERAA